MAVLMVAIMMMTKMIKVMLVTLMGVVGYSVTYSRNHSFEDGLSIINWVPQDFNTVRTFALIVSVHVYCVLTSCCSVTKHHPS